MSDTLNETDHTNEGVWGSLKGTCATPNTQPAGLNMDQGVPANTASALPAPESDFLSYPTHVAGIGGQSGSKNGTDPESQASVF